MSGDLRDALRRNQVRDDALEFIKERGRGRNDTELVDRLLAELDRIVPAAQTSTPNLEQIIADALSVPILAGRRRDPRMKIAAHLVAAIRDSGLTVIALPEGEGPDDDGQMWFDDFDIRVDTTGSRDDTRLYVNSEPRTPSAVHQHAVALLSAALVAGGGA